MKKVLLTAIALWFAGGLMAQQVGFRMGDKINMKAINPEWVHLAGGVQEGEVLAVEPVRKAVTAALVNPLNVSETIAANPVKAVKVRLCDMEWRDKASVTLADTKGAGIAEVFRSRSRLHALLRFEAKKRLALRHVLLDAQSLAIVQDEMLLDRSLQKGEEGQVWVAGSPDGRYHGVVYAVQRKKEAPVAVARMYDSTMAFLWERELAYGDVRNVIVSDSGTITTAILGTIKGEKDVTAFRLNQASADGEKHGEYVLNASVSNLALLNSDGGRILAVALEEKGGKSGIGAGARGKSLYTGIWGLVFDLDGDEIAVGNRHPFTDDDLRLLANAESDWVPDSREADFVRLTAHCTTPQGGAALFQRMWMTTVVTVRGGTMRSETVNLMGMLVVQADMQGRLTVSRLPQCNSRSEWPPVVADVFPYGGKVYVLTNESELETGDYHPDRPALPSRHLLKHNAALSLHWFTPDGQGGKQMLETGRSTLLGSPAYAAGGGRFLFLTQSAGSYLANISIPQ